MANYDKMRRFDFAIYIFFHRLSEKKEISLNMLFKCSDVNHRKITSFTLFFLSLQFEGGTLLRLKNRIIVLELVTNLNFPLYFFLNVPPRRNLGGTGNKRFVKRNKTLG